VCVIRPRRGLLVSGLEALGEDVNHRPVPPRSVSYGGRGGVITRIRPFVVRPRASARPAHLSACAGGVFLTYWALRYAAAQPRSAANRRPPRIDLVEAAKATRASQQEVPDPV